MSTAAHQVSTCSELDSVDEILKAMASLLLLIQTHV